MSAAEDYAISVMNGRPGLLPGILRVGLALLAQIYRLGLEAYLLPFEIGLRKRRRLPCPVLSVGNLSAGGTGKTPLTQSVCRALVARGYAPAILSRGYRGREEFGCAIVADRDGVHLSPEEAGDEAYLLAVTLPGVPIVVGKDRRVTGSLAIARFAPDLLVLDDGLQFWQLHRDVDLVLLDASRPFDNGWTFPRGLLREPPAHLRRAGIVVLTRTGEAGPERTRRARKEVSRYAAGKPVFEANLRPTGLKALDGSPCPPFEWLCGRRIAALSAVGNPESFEATLTALGADIVRVFRYRDHLAVASSDLERICAEAQASGAEAIITTEKDAVKLHPGAIGLPILWLSVEMTLCEEQAFYSDLLGSLGFR